MFSELAQSGLLLEGVIWAPLLQEVSPAQPSSSPQVAGRGTRVSSNVVLLQPRPGAAVFWKGRLVLHPHLLVDGREGGRMSWNPFTVARVFTPNTDRVADTEV